MDTRTNVTAPLKPSANGKKRLLGNLEISSFCGQMAMIVSSGIPVYEGISILKENAPDDTTKEILTSIYQSLETGATLYETLTISGIFPKYVLDMLELGETTGHLEDVLYSLRDYYEREESIRSSIRNAITYPLIMIGIMIAVILVLVSRVLPVFHQIYNELGAQLNGLPLFLMNLSLHLNQYMAYIILFLILLLFSGIVLIKSNTGKILFLGKNLAMNISASRFANCMYMVLSSGFDTTQGLDFAMRLVDNPHMEERIRRCKEFSDSGQSFSNSVIAAGIFDKLHASMISIASKTGSMDQIMHQFSKEYEADFDRKIIRFITILEPTLIIILSIIIGLILTVFLLPLVGMMSSIG